MGYWDNKNWISASMKLDICWNFCHFKAKIEYYEIISTNYGRQFQSTEKKVRFSPNLYHFFQLLLILYWGHVFCYFYSTASSQAKPNYFIYLGFTILRTKNWAHKDTRDWDVWKMVSMVPNHLENLCHLTPTIY